MSGIHSTHNSFAFIQARLGSTRFPKKILKQIPEGSDSTFLDHIHRRLKTVFDSNQIVFLIPESDIESIQYLKTKGYLYFCGSELDVRDRFRKAAKHFGAKHIFRLTADNPFIDIDSIRYLYEAILEIAEKYYSLSMEGLPLGMGVECFSADSLFYHSEETELERHKEHVSLHIKEFPEIHRQYRLSPPHLQSVDAFQQLSKNEISKLRITVDEWKDYELICEIWKTLGDKNANFGAEEVLQLYQNNPHMFSLNASVEQIVFELPKNEKTKKQVNILYGKPDEYGYGHFERCKSLSIYLQLYGYDVKLTSSFDNSEINVPHIFDIRENEFSVRNSFFIDNVNHPPNNTNACYFLPHPSYPILNTTLEKASFTKLSYYSSPISEVDRGLGTSPGKLLVYAGQLDETQSEQIDNFLLQFHQSKMNSQTTIFQSILRIGGTKPKDNNIQFVQRIPYTEFLKEMEFSEWIFTYFGQTMMECVAKGKKVCLFGISEIHETLGKFAEKELNIPYVGTLTELSNLRHFPKKTIPKKIKYVRDAHIQILNWLNSINSAIYEN
ncbi:cytidylyltransferase domain-containing protein [Leptospira bouyouniensis]|uniref:cytidylyltransferase domain-containing protein n=1 Tax=Leptospira bouyouniensis TaxID=2484911 RepID=UPI0010914B90|nr:spore coat biosynthesis protein F [Leptospira bouyouniensis]TGM87716.1 spore coat biosynthesis protein F [Leptospira bouyouniensis]